MELKIDFAVHQPDGENRYRRPYVAVSEATRKPGVYSVIWNGEDDQKNLVGSGEYTLYIEAAREHGTYQLIRKKLEFTGITLNHPTWFGGESETSSTLKANMPLAWVALDESDGDNVSETSSAEARSLEPGLDQLKIAEYLRDKHHLRGMVKEFRIDEEECSIAYKGPGYSADVFIDRRTGEYELSLIQHGTLGKWNDLHKGRDSGIPWSIMIDVSAIVMIISAATGLAMLFFLKRKRTSGLASALCGALIFAAFYVFFIP